MEFASNNLSSGIAACGLYFFAHTLRSLRFWILSNDESLSFRITFAIIFLTAVMGYWLPAVVGEIFRLYLLWRVTGNLPRQIAVSILARSLDLVVLGISFLGYSLWIAPSATNASLGLGIAGLLAGALAISLVFALNRLVRLSKNALIARYHHRFFVSLVRALNALGRETFRLSRDGTSILTLGFVLSLVVWLCDAGAVTLALKNYPHSVPEILGMWAHRSFQSILQIATPSQATTPLAFDANLESVLRSRLLVPLSEVAVVLVAALTANFAFRYRTTGRGLSWKNHS